VKKREIIEVIESEEGQFKIKNWQIIQ
jgi:hypothetical protein